jgi:hypothetical protein
MYQDYVNQLWRTSDNIKELERTKNRQRRYGTVAPEPESQAEAID